MANQTQTQPRRWVTEAPDPAVVDANDYAALQEEMWWAMGLLMRAGGAVTIHAGPNGANIVIGAVRRPADADKKYYETTHFVWQWNPGVPAVRSEPTVEVEPVEMRDMDEAEVEAALNGG